MGCTWNYYKSDFNANMANWTLHNVFFRFSEIIYCMYLPVLNVTNTALVCRTLVIDFEDIHKFINIFKLLYLVFSSVYLLNA